MRKNESITVRCSSEKKELLEIRAKDMGVSLSEYVIKSALNEKAESISVSRKMVRTITQLQASSNAIVVELNKAHGGYPYDIDELQAYALKIQKGVGELWKLLK